MKATHSRFGLGVLAFCALVFTAGCDFDAAQEAFDNLAIILELDDIETTASGQLVNAATNELLGVQATLRFVGPNGDDIVDFFNDPTATITASGGLASFGLSNALTPSASDPIEFTVIATAKGYLPSSTTVTITKDGSENPFLISMMRQSASGAAAGTTTGSASVPSSNGTVSNVTTVDVSDTSSGAEVTTVIPSGPRLVTAEGTPLSGAVTTSLSYYNNDSPASLRALPSGYTQGSGNKGFALGFASSLFITDASGNSASRLIGTGKRPTGGEARIELAPGFENPLTGAAVAVNDNLTIRVWNSGEAEWTTPANSTLPVQEDVDNGTLFVDLVVDATGYYAFVFPIPPSTGCTADGEFTLTGVSDGTYNVSLQSLAGGGAIDRTVRVENGATTYTESFADRFGIQSSSTALEYTLTVSKNTTSVTAAVNVCSGTTTVPMPTSSATTKNVRIEVKPECGPGREARVTGIPATAIFYRASDAPAGTFWTHAGSPDWQGNNGDESTFLVRGVLDIDQIDTAFDYDFYTTYDGNRYTETGVSLQSVDRTEDGRDVISFTIDAGDVCS